MLLTISPTKQPYNNEDKFIHGEYHYNSNGNTIDDIKRRHSSTKRRSAATIDYSNPTTLEMQSTNNNNNPSNNNANHLYQAPSPDVHQHNQHPQYIYMQQGTTNNNVNSPPYGTHPGAAALQISYPGSSSGNPAYPPAQQSVSNSRNVPPPQHQPSAGNIHVAAATGNNTNERHKMKSDVFVQDSMGWSCRHCNTMPYSYRAPGSVWQGVDPPNSSFIEQHLQVCHGSSIVHPQLYSPQQHQHQQQQMYHQQQQMMQHHHQHHHQQQSIPPPHHNRGAPPPLSAAYYQPLHHAHAAYAAAAPPLHAHALSPPIVPPAGAIQHGYNPIGGASAGAAGGAVSSGGRFIFPPSEVPPEYALVQPDDKLLLTDYFYYLMQQLQVCYFAESDRKTRGGKRDNIAVGFGGLQCRHCAARHDARKFFWSDVDRLANSFAEIPSHVLKCRECPPECKNNLIHLKSQHPEQMARLPRGSQKVFFRRMWRRIHGDSADSATSSGLTSPKPSSAAQSIKSKYSADDHDGEHNESSQAGASASSAMVSQDQSSQEQAMPSSQASSSKDDGAASDSDGVSLSKGPAKSGSKGDSKAPSSAAVTVENNGRKVTLLAIEDDKEWLSDMDCFVRRNLEVFRVTRGDIDIAKQDKRDPIVLNQVGIRCIHCASINPAEARGSATFFPLTIGSIYESVRNFQRFHFETCVNVPPEVQTKLASLSQCTSLTSVLRRYYVLAAKALGMLDGPSGIKFSNDSDVPVAVDGGNSGGGGDYSTTGKRVREELEESAPTGDGSDTEQPDSKAPRREEPM